MSATVQQSRSLEDMRKDAGDIPIFVGLVKTLKPRFFVQDNLPKSLIGYPIHMWARELPDYDLFPEWVSNWGYGNVQKYRKRFFMIGARKEEKFVFRPWENDIPIRLGDVIADCPPTNNETHTLTGPTSKGRGVYSDEPFTWAEYQKFMLESEDGVTIPYKAKDGSWKKHVGWRKAFKDGYVPVITGGCPIANPYTGLPFSIRERCRIQGLPDDFVIYGTKLNEDGTWNHNKNSAVIKQTGKCMPVQFCEYVSQQIMSHIRKDDLGLDMDTTYPEAKRILNPNEHIDQAKQWYCDNVGYADQKTACRFCWIRPACTKQIEFV